MSSMSCIPNGDRCFYIDYVNDWLNIYEYILTTGARNPRISAEFTVTAIYGYNVELNEMCAIRIANENTIVQFKHIFVSL